jgi:N-formylglutamate deformylase
VEIIRGNGPVILGQPHCGTFLPPEVRARLNEQGRLLADTDWHVDRLYDGLLSDATIVRANFHRYVIDANRDPSGRSLYSSHNTTGLIPEVSFDNAPIWTESVGEEEVDQRLFFHSAYHEALEVELRRVRKRHATVVVFDCHSIRSEIPFLFDHRLPDFNIGDNDGATCDSGLTRSVADVCAKATGYSHVVNGRFRGGWTTRHYGRPARGVHAIQLELAQRTYLVAEAPPFGFSKDKAAVLRPILKSILSETERFALELA